MFIASDISSITNPWNILLFISFQMPQPMINISNRANFSKVHSASKGNVPKMLCIKKPHSSIIGFFSCTAKMDFFYHFLNDLLEELFLHCTFIVDPHPTKINAQNHICQCVDPTSKECLVWITINSFMQALYIRPAQCTIPYNKTSIMRYNHGNQWKKNEKITQTESDITVP